MITTSFLMFLVLVFAVGMFIASGFRVVHQQQVAIVETLGKFSRTLDPGLHWIIPVIQQIKGKVNMKIQEVQDTVDVKTKDNVFVSLPVSIQLVPNENNVEDAFYKLQYPEAQIKSWILNSVRSIANNMDLDELFSDKDHIVNEVHSVLVKRLSSFGYVVEAVLVEPPVLPKDMQHSFNRVIAAKREAEAATQEGEAIRIKAVAQANAEAESQRVRAQGMADARSILAKGLTASIDELEDKHLNPQQAVDTLVELNRLDVIRETGARGNLILFDMGANSNAVTNKEVMGLIAQKNKKDLKTEVNNVND